MSDNPFKAPQPIDSQKAYDQPVFHDGSGRVFVRQVSVIAILLIVQGVLLAIFAVFCLGYAFFFNNIEALIPASAQGDINTQLPPGQRTMMVWVFGVWAACSILLGLLHIVTGIFNFGLHGRVLGIATLLVGICSALTCYCAITGIPLSIYGLIIYFNPAVAEAFRLRKTGMSKERVLATFVR